MNILKLFTTLFFFLSLFLVQACRTNSPAETVNGEVKGVEKTGAPYSSSEPERYQTEIWQTSSRGTEKFFVARSGEKWRMDALFGTPEQVTTIHVDKEYVISFATKVYAEYPVNHGYDDREETVNAMTGGMLNVKETAVYEKIGADAGMTKYKVVSDAGTGRESIVYFDDKLGLPVKKEMFKLSESGKVSEMTITLSGFKTEADEKLFTLPEGLKKISAEEMKKVLTASK